MKIFFIRKLFFSYEYKRLQSLTLDIQIHIEAISWCKNYDAFHQMIFHCKREKKTHNKIDDKMECERIEMPCIHLCQNSYDNMIHSISYKTFFSAFLPKSIKYISIILYASIERRQNVLIFPSYQILYFFLLLFPLLSLLPRSTNITKLNAYIYEKKKQDFKSRLEASHVCYTYELKGLFYMRNFSAASGAFRNEFVV